jgi:protein-L-isoaspartate O-methyltransferase
MANLVSNLTLRRILIPALRFIGSFNVTIRHDLTRKPMRAHVFKHKGYWFYGSKREKDTLLFIQRIVAAGDTVLDVGANIGYLTMLFAHLVGETGRVVAFEPGENDLPYLTANASSVVSQADRLLLRVV